MKKKNGYTLAEVLVTLAILGLVIGITLPVLNRARPNQEMIMFKKAYFNTARVVSELINDEDLYPDRDDDQLRSGFSNTSISDLTDGEHEATFRGREYWGDGKFCGLFAAKMGVENPNCDQAIPLDDGGNFMTQDGVVWSMPIGSFADGWGIIGVDINGDRGRNCSPPLGNEDAFRVATCQGTNAPDQFYISVGRFGEISALGDVEREYIRTNKTSKTYTDIRACAPNCD